MIPVRAALLALVVAGCSAQAPAEQPEKIQILTALPLFWGEGGPTDIVQGGAGRSPVLAALDDRYAVKPIDFADSAALSAAPLLVLAQPMALRPEELVAIDDWVRGGGRALIFADPALIWPTELAASDPRRAPPSSLLGPLLTHWQLQLGGPAGRDDGAVAARVDQRLVMLAAPGYWAALGGNCAARDRALIATCQIGKGRAILVADADMLDSRLWTQSGAENRAVIVALVDQLRAAPESAGASVTEVSAGK